MLKTGRRQSRETAFSLVFEWGFKEEETLDEIISQAAVGRSLEVDDFAYQLASKTISGCPELDKRIETYSTKWKLNRIPRVTLAVLRMSFCEMTMIEGIPVGATINEAVELVKKFATEDDASYVNGILGQFERDRSGKSAEAVQAEQEEAASGHREVLPGEQLEQEAQKLPDAHPEGEA